MVHNDDELRAALAECVNHPEKRREERRRLLVRAVTQTDGKSCERFVNAINIFLAGGAPRR
jgi:hypothetical protein